MQTHPKVPKTEDAAASHLKYHNRFSAMNEINIPVKH